MEVPGNGDDAFVFPQIGLSVPLYRSKYKAMIKQACKDGIAIDLEEYIEGIRGFAVPLKILRANTQIAIWAVGLKRQITNKNIPRYSRYLKKIAAEIEIRLTEGY